MELMDSLMTLEEVASYLRLSKDTVYRMAQSGKIPACKVGGQWRFRRDEVEQWLEDHSNVSGGSPGSDSENAVDT